MKVTRSSILNLLLVAALLATLPSAIVRLWQSGNPYLLTADFFQDLLARLTGPGRLRFVLQPLTAIYLGVRSGAKDARSGRSAFLWALLFHAEHRKEILLDLVAQALIFHEIRPGPALIIGPPLILVPYALSRALTNRIAQRRAVHAAWHAH
jgi:hypothetical protein